MRNGCRYSSLRVEVSRATRHAAVEGGWGVASVTEQRRGKDE